MTESHIIKPGDLWGVFVGINEYADPEWGVLPFCEKDASELAGLFGDPGRGGYESSNIRLLIGSEASAALKPTRNNIIAATRHLINVAATDDTVLFGFFGHGLEAAGNSYVLPWDSFSSSLSDTAISLRWIQESLQQSRARVKLLIFDACHSGSLRGRSARPMSRKLASALEELAGNEGWVVFSSCKQDELSHDFPEQQHGVFTHFLLEALNGAADVDRDGVITANDTATYTINNTKRWAFSKGVNQNPEFKCNLTGADVILVDRTRRWSDKQTREHSPTLAVMGTKGGVGKSTTIAAMAELIASAGHSVLVIDGDIETGGITKYLSARASRHPRIWTVIDAAYAHQNDSGPPDNVDYSFWDVTPQYLISERFGRIFLVPARLPTDTRLGYNALANIYPESKRNEAALKLLEDTVSRLELTGRNVDCILVDSGAEQNPLVSAGFALAKYGYVVSIPHPEFRIEVPRLERMHQERYADHMIGPMSVIVNQATAGTSQLWAGVPNTHFVREDATLRRVAASGGRFDFEGVGLNQFYLDVLRALRSTFDSNDQHLLPDEDKVWIRPYLEAMKDFPEKRLSRPLLRFLKPATLIALTCCLALLVFAGVLYRRTSTPELNVITRHAIAKPSSTLQSDFLERLTQVRIPEDFLSRVWLDGNVLVIKGDLSKDDIATLKTVSDYEPFRDAVVESALPVQNNIKAALDENILFRQTVFFAALLSLGSFVSIILRYRILAQRKRLLLSIVETRNAGAEDQVVDLIHKLTSDGAVKPQLRWLREEFRKHRPALKDLL
jgi:cellulose biosynthesis protein BcsQ